MGWVMQFSKGRREQEEDGGSHFSSPTLLRSSRLYTPGASGSCFPTCERGYSMSVCALKQCVEWATSTRARKARGYEAISAS